MTVYVPPELILPPLPYPCGRAFYGDVDGTITSPVREPGQDCQWQIRAPIGHQLRMFIDSIDLVQRYGTIYIIMYATTHLST